MRQVVIYLSIFISFVLLATIIPVVHAEGGTLTPSKSTYNLVVGTSGDSITILYSGNVNPPSGTATCELEVYTVNDFGLIPKVENRECDASSGYISVTLTFNGAYNGKEGSYTPISGVLVKYYNVNNTEIGTDYLTTAPIQINKITMTASVQSVDTSSLSYMYRPSTPKVGDTIRIFTVGTITLSIQLSAPPDVSTSVLLEVTQPSGFHDTKTVYISSGSTYTTVNFQADVSTYVNYKITSADGSIIIAQDKIDMPDVNADNVILVVEQPYSSNNPDGETVNVYAPVYVSKITSGSLTVNVNVEGSYNGTTITSSGLYTIEVDNLPKGDHTGTYNIMYSSQYGSVSLEVQFSTSNARITTGGVITNIFYYTFLVIVVASFASTISGFLIRRPDLMSAGLLGMASSVLVFMIPTIMGYAVRLLIEAGVSQPPGINLGDLNMFNLGDKIDASISWTVTKAIDYANNLRVIGLVLLGLLAALAALAAGVGVVGWLTAGALSQFIGRVAGEFGAQLVLLSTYSLFASYMLEVMARIYPLVLNVILVVMFFSVLLYALFSAYTGNIGQVYGPIVQFSILILTVLLVPLMLSSIDMIQNEYGTISMPDPINRVIDSIPNPFFWLAATLIEMVILVMVMYMAFNRLVSILSGGAG